MCHTQPSTDATPSGRVETVHTACSGPVEVRVHTASVEGPPVVVVPDFFGPSPFYSRLAARLRDTGFTAVVADPYHGLAPVEAGDHVAALRRLERRPDVEVLQDLRDVMDAARAWSGHVECGVVGFCAGGTWAMCLAEQPDVVAVAFYGFPEGLPGGEDRLVPVDRTDRLRSPLLAVWGEQDEAVGQGAIQRYARSAGDAATTVVHPDVGHGFLRGLDAPDDPAAPAARAAWDMASSFLLGPGRANAATR